MRVLVTGSQGYLGRPLVAALRADGHDVTPLDSAFFLRGSLDPSPADRRADIRDVVLELFAGHDAVIHLAELSNDPLGSMNRDLTVDINQRGSTHVADLAADAGVQRFVYFSSCSVYGASGADLVTEESPVDPLTAYAESKIVIESHLRSMHRPGFVPVILRNATAYGASPALRLDLAINEFVYDAVTSGKVVMRSSGTAWRPFAHVDDIGRAARAALVAPVDAVDGQIVNVGSEASTMTVRQVAEIVARLCDADLVTADDSADARTYRVSFEKLLRVLGNDVVTVSMEEGIAGLRDFVSANRAWMAEKGRDAFRRLPVLAGLMDEGQVDGSLRWLR